MKFSANDNKEGELPKKIISGVIKIITATQKLAKLFFKIYESYFYLFPTRDHNLAKKLLLLLEPVFSYWQQNLA